MKPPTPRWTRALGVVLLAASALGGAAGCKDDACQQMVRCCDAAADVEGVGSACGALARDVRDPSTCKTILKTVRFVYEDKAMEPPAVCLPAAGPAGGQGEPTEVSP